MTDLGHTASTVNTALRALRKLKSGSSLAGPCCLALLEERADGLFSLLCNCMASAKSGPLHLLRRAAR